MKTKILTSILLSVLVTCFVSAGLATAANGNGAGLERVPVFIGFRQTPGPSEQALVRAHGGAIKYSYTLVPAIAASIPEPAIQGLLRNPNVTYIEPVLKVYAVTQTVPWGVERIGAPTVHDGGNKGEGVKVAIIDSGIDYTHPDLASNYAGGWDFVNNDAYPMDDDGHGTHVAGTVAAEDNDIGVVGVAPGASLYALKALEGGSGSYDDVIAALEWAKAKGIQVTNNSYGSSGDPGITVETAFNTCPAVHVCAAGNTGKWHGRGDNVIYPARYASCIAVAATDSSDNRAYFSSTGPDVEISAPGVGINSTVPGGGYSDDYSGTSMASPHVAGVAALIIASGIPVDVRTQLKETADYLGDPLLYGYGLVDADEAAPPPVGNQAPVASFTDTISGLTVALDASASYDPDGTIVSYAWDFGDFSPIGAGVTTEHTYDTAGTYTVILTVTDDDGAWSTASQDVIVSEPTGNQSPIAAFTVDPASGVVPLTVSFDASASNDPDGTIDSYAWDFGDFSPIGAGVTTEHTYDTAGTYTVILTVTDNDGAEGTTSEVVTVSESTTLLGIYVDGFSRVSSWSSRVWWDAYVDIWVVDGSDKPVEGAIVHGMWSTGQSAISQMTDGNGWCEVTLSGIHKKNATVTFTVTDIVCTGYEYTEPEPPEGAPSITIPRP